MRFLRVAIIVVCLLSALPCGGAALAQRDLGITLTSVDDSAFPEVTAILTADRNGRPITEISLPELQIRESGAVATPISVSRAVDSNLPVAVVMMIDISGSMRGEPVTRAKEAAISLLNGLRPGDRVAVLTLSDEVRVEQPLTDDREAVRSTIARLDAVDRGTALYDAVVESARTAAASGLARRAVVFLTDGVEPPGQFARSRASRAESVTAVANAASPFYLIGLGTDIDQQYLEELARRSQGRYFQAPQPAQLTEAYAALEELLRSQFAVTFRSPAPADLQDRSVQITLVQAGGSASAELAYRSRRSPAQGSSPPLLGFALVALALLAAAYVVLRRRRPAPSPVASVVLTDQRLPIEHSVAVDPTWATVVLAPGGDTNERRSFKVGEAPVTIGSGAQCVVQLPEAPGVATEHARMWLRDGRLLLHHIAPGYVTQLDGSSVDWASLEEGDELIIGPHVLRCSVANGEVPAKAMEIHG